MLIETTCEVCGRNDWQILGQRTYTEFEGKNSPPYEQKRFRVLFEKWFPDQKSVTISSVLCRRCGFIMYLPRPEEQDIASQYMYLEKLAKDYDYGQDSPLDSPSPVVLKRANNLFRYLNKNIDLLKVNKIMDYGGGDGSLMYDFNKIGKQCFLVDYSKKCVQGVTKLSDTVHELNPNEKFDLIICSHVMEHIAQPLQILKKLTTHLSEGGYVFIEVPLGVWKLPPLPPEPVTHINFFTPNNLHNLLLLGGLVVRRCEITASLFQSGIERHGIRAIARKMNNHVFASDIRLLHPDGLELIKPSSLKRIRHQLYFPLEIPKEIVGRLFRLAKWIVSIFK